jgi:pyruvate dehydrogenase E2 component (dihydrolipoamide acetyltransferase)
VLAFADALHLDEIHLVGHSLGGAIAIEAARQSKGKVRSLALIASAGLGPEINGDYIAGFVKAASRREMKPVVETLFADPQKVTRQLVEDLLKYKRLDGVEAALGALAESTFKDGRQQVLLADELGRLGLPVLIVWGAEDKILPAAHAAKASGAKVEVIPGAGHMVQMEAAAKVNALLEEHLERA